MAKVYIETAGININVGVDAENLYTATFALCELLGEVDKLKANKAQGRIVIVLDEVRED